MKIKIFRAKLYIYEIKLLSLHTNKEKTMSNISDAVASKGGIITTDSMTGQAEYKRVLRAVDRGELIRLRHGVYAVPEATFGTMIDIDKIVPGGVVCKGSGDRYLNHLYTIKKWHAKQEGIQIAEYITPTAHLMNSSSNRSINIFKTKMNQGPVP